MADLTTKQVLQKLGKDILNWVKTNCVDNLVSTSKNLPLSANQGRVLKEGQDAINQSLGDLSDRFSYIAPDSTKTWQLRMASFLMIGLSDTTAALLYVTANKIKVLSQLSSSELSNIDVSVNDYKVTVTNTRSWGITAVMLYV